MLSKQFSCVKVLAILFAFGLTSNSCAFAAEGNVFNVRDFGASGDGRSADTDSINRSIISCAAAGGGQVLFPPGHYLSGTIHLKSNVALVFAKAATLIGTDDLAQYKYFEPPRDTHEARFRPQWHAGLILGIGVKNISITGDGMIDGAKVFDPKGEERMRGPHTILLGDCQDVEIRGVTIRDSANYAVMLEHCHNVDIRSMKITGGWDAIHFRGWAGRPCENISIVDCQLFTGDDCIAGRYWKNVLIKNCVINSSCNGIRVIGPAENLIVNDCLFFGPGRFEHRTSNRNNMLAGIILQPGAWDSTEGHLDDVLISDNTMHNVTTPLQVTLKSGNTAGEITVQRLAATGVYRAACSVESWTDEPIERFVMRDVSIEYTGGGKRAEAASAISEPRLDARSLPAWGLLARNVKRVDLQDVRLRTKEPDQRHVLILDSVNILAAEGVRFPVDGEAATPIVLHNVNQTIWRDSSDDNKPLPRTSQDPLNLESTRATPNVEIPNASEYDR